MSPAIARDQQTSPSQSQGESVGMHRPLILPILGRHTIDTIPSLHQRRPRDRPCTRRWGSQGEEVQIGDAVTSKNEVDKGKNRAMSGRKRALLVGIQECRPVPADISVNVQGPDLEGEPTNDTPAKLSYLRVGEPEVPAPCPPSTSVEKKKERKRPTRKDAVIDMQLPKFTSHNIEDPVRELATKFEKGGMPHLHNILINVHHPQLHVPGDLTPINEDSEAQGRLTPMDTPAINFPTHDVNSDGTQTSSLLSPGPSPSASKLSDLPPPSTSTSAFTQLSLNAPSPATSVTTLSSDGYQHHGKEPSEVEPGQPSQTQDAQPDPSPAAAQLKVSQETSSETRVPNHSAPAASAAPNVPRQPEPSPTAPSPNPTPKAPSTRRQAPRRADSGSTTSSKIKGLLQRSSTVLSTLSIFSGVRFETSTGPRRLSRLWGALRGLPGDHSSGSEPSSSKPLNKGKKKATMELDVDGDFIEADIRPLSWCHQGVKEMKRVLIQHYGYMEEDIVCMTEEASTPEDLHPTRANLLHQMKELMKDIEDGDSFFFYYAGHGLQQKQPPDEPVRERDGMDEYMVTVDRRTIQDDLLHDLLIKPLCHLSKCKFTAVLDACNSATLLDLQHMQCHQGHYPEIAKYLKKRPSWWLANLRIAGIPISRCRSSSRSGSTGSMSKATVDDPQPPSSQPSSSQPSSSQPSSSQPRKSNSQGSSHSGKQSKPSLPRLDTNLPQAKGIILDLEEVQSPSETVKYADCEGHCQAYMCDRVRKFVPTIVVLSAGKDNQLVWEGAKGEGLTHFLVRKLDEDPHPTLRPLVDDLTRSLFQLSIDQHSKSRKFVRKLCRFMKDPWKAIRQETALWKGAEATLRARAQPIFQLPQVSSNVPLNMKEHIWSP